MPDFYTFMEAVCDLVQHISKALVRSRGVNFADQQPTLQTLLICCPYDDRDLFLLPLLMSPYL